MALPKIVVSPKRISQATNILKVAGPLGGVVSALVAEFVVQQFEKRAPASVPGVTQAINFGQTELVGNAPFLGSVKVRDLPSLAPSISAAASLLIKRGKLTTTKILTAAAAYGTKVMIRRQGYNPKGLADFKKEEKPYELMF